MLRLKKHSEFIKRVKVIEEFERRSDPPINRLLTVMGGCDEPVFVQLAMTPTPALFEAFARHLFRRHETRMSRERREHLLVRDRSMVEDAELRGGLDVQHKPLFFVDLRVIAERRAVCELIASELRADNAENRLVERGTAVRHGLLGLYGRRVQRGEGNPLPSFRKGVFASRELARDLAAAERGLPRPSRSRAARSRARPLLPRSRGRRTDAGRCAMRSERCRSTWSCAARTPPSLERWSRASRASLSQPSPRTCAASGAR